MEKNVFLGSFHTWIHWRFLCGSDSKLQCDIGTKERNKTTEMTRTRWSRVKSFHWRLWKQSPPTVVDVSRASGQLENQKKNDPGSRHLLFMSSPQSCTTTPEIVSNWLFVPEQREEHTVYATQVLYTDTFDRELCRKSRMSVFVSTSASLKVFCPGESESPPAPRTTLVGVSA